ncbi:MAG: hypothetical protein O3B47_05065, partial [bacterium]|nr:hypothetical protein [bacterium]
SSTIPTAENFSDSLNNEVVKKKPSYPLIAVIGGALILAITAAAYYFLIFTKQSAPVEEAPAVVEIPTEAVEITQPPAVTEETTDISTDPIINEIEALGNSDSTTQIEEELDSIDFDGIDTGLQLSGF